MEPKLIVVSEFTDPSANSTGYFWHHLIQHLGDRGHGVEVVSLTGENSQKLKRLKFFRALVKLCRSLKLLLLTLYFCKRRDLLVSGTNPEFLVPAMALVRVMIGLPWCLVLHDIFPNTLLASKLLAEDSFRYRLLERLYSWAYRNADSIVIIGRDMRETMEGKGVTANKISYIPNWVDLDSVEPLSRDASPVLLKYGIAQKFVFQFFGNIGRMQDITTLLSAIELLKREEGLAFLFIGDGTEAHLVEAAVRRGIHPNIIFMGPIPHADKSIGLNACDVAIVSVSAGVKGVAVPSKAYFSFAADKQVLAVSESGSELDLMISEHSIGWLGPAGSPASLAKKIMEVREEVLSSREAVSPREVMRVHYSQDVLLDQFESCLAPFIER